MGEQRVLLIEDDPETNRLFGELLSEEGFDVTSSSHSSLPARDGHVLVVTDLDAGSRRYSSEVARDWIRTLRARYDVPVVVVTGHMEALHDPALRSDVADLMLKPVDIDDLSTRLRAALERPLV